MSSQMQTSEALRSEESFAGKGANLVHLALLRNQIPSACFFLLSVARVQTNVNLGHEILVNPKVGNILINIDNLNPSQVWVPFQLS